MSIDKSIEAIDESMIKALKSGSSADFKETKALVDSIEDETFGFSQKLIRLALDDNSTACIDLAAHELTRQTFVFDPIETKIQSLTSPDFELHRSGVWIYRKYFLATQKLGNTVIASQGKRGFIVPMLNEFKPNVIAIRQIDDETRREMALAACAASGIEFEI